MTILRILTAVAIVTTLAATSAHAQAQRLSGTIEKVDGGTLAIKTRDGATATLKLADNAVVTAVLKATVADIKPGAYIGSGAVPQADGTQKAVEVTSSPNRCAARATVIGQDGTALPTAP